MSLNVYLSSGIFYFNSIYEYTYIYIPQREYCDVYIKLKCIKSYQININPEINLDFILSGILFHHFYRTSNRTKTTKRL